MDAGNGARGRVVPIASARTWPCVGDPATWGPNGEWMTCGADGVRTLLATVPGSTLDPLVDPVPSLESGEVFAVVTVCPAHVKPVRAWLRTNVTRPDAVWTLGTEALMRGWGQIVDRVDLPVRSTVLRANVG